MYISFFGCRNLGAHANIPVWKSFWICHWLSNKVLKKNFWGRTNYQYLRVEQKPKIISSKYCYCQNQWTRASKNFLSVLILIKIVTAFFKNIPVEVAASISFIQTTKNDIFITNSWENAATNLESTNWCPKTVSISL